VSYFDTDVLHERIAELQQELLKKHSKVHEALRLRDLANERIAKLNDLVDMIVNSESADKVLITAFYHSFLHEAKQLKGGAE
jgi:hypothetical protein